MSTTSAGTVISTILRHEAKTASYKIALIRSLNDVVLGFPALRLPGKHQYVAVPIRLLAELWIAYYWPFVGNAPVLQGRPQGLKHDISFRPELTELRSYWDSLNGTSSDADGYFLVGEARSSRRLQTYPPGLFERYHATIKAIVHAIQQPIRYAGVGNWSVFPKPQRWSALRSMGSAVEIPGTVDSDLCLLVQAKLWDEFLSVSLWVEALCVHEWSLFTESLTGTSRGKIYEALTCRPDNRRPLTWERNHIELLMMEGNTFICPWTGHELNQRTFDLDHLIPLAVYPTNELWNLVPADRIFNQRVKRARLPRNDRLPTLVTRLTQSYQLYGKSPDLWRALQNDTVLRFKISSADANFHYLLATSVRELIEVVRESRNVAEF